MPSGLGAVKCAVRTSPGDVGGCVRPGVCSVGQCPQWACDRALPTFLWVPHATPASGEGQGAWSAGNIPPSQRGTLCPPLHHEGILERSPAHRSGSVGSSQEVGYPEPGAVLCDIITSLGQPPLTPWLTAVCGTLSAPTQKTLVSPGTLPGCLLPAPGHRF